MPALIDGDKTIQWQDVAHSKMTLSELYALLQLRCAVFIVEQNCPFQDIDGRDISGDTRHILGWHNGQLVACARLLIAEPGHEDDVVIGRVVVSEHMRGAKVGQQLLSQALTACATHWPGRPMYLGAQSHLQSFYGRHGFAVVTDEYMEDGIPHVGMARPAVLSQ